MAIAVGGEWKHKTPRYCYYWDEIEWKENGKSPWHYGYIAVHSEWEREPRDKEKEDSRDL